MGEDERPPASHCGWGVLLSYSSLLASNSSKKRSGTNYALHSRPRQVTGISYTILRPS